MIAFTPRTRELTDAGFDRLVAGLYDASTGGQDWSAALEPIQEVFGARAIVMHTLDLAESRLLSLHLGGPSLSRTVHDYVTQWEQHDTRKHRVLALGAQGFGQWLHCHDAVDETSRQRNAFHRHFLAGHEARYNSLQVIPLDERTVTGFTFELHSSRGPLDADERELARRLGQHLEQALRGHERMRQLAAKTLVGHQLLQAFAYPMWLLTPDRGVLFANEAAQDIERSERPLLRRQQRLCLANATDDRQLTLRLHQLAQAGHLARAPLRLGPPGALAEHGAWLHLSVLHPQQVMGCAFGPQRCVLATLFRPAQVTALDPFTLAQMFELTPAEARVAALLAEGQEPTAIADRLNVRLTTVRTHVREVLAKMGQQRVTDVVRVLRQGEALWAMVPGVTPSR